MSVQLPGPGYLLFAVGMAGVGLLSLIYGDFALNWQPVPDWVPWRLPLACASGVMLLASGAGMLFRATARYAAALLTINLVVWLLLLEVPRVVAAPGVEAMWLGVGETLVLVAGGLISLAAVSSRADRWIPRFAIGEEGAGVGRLLFAIGLPMIGLSHWVYSEQTVALVPAWLPQRLALGLLTGAGHIAAGIALLLSVVPRLAATLEAVMMSSFVLLIHVPGVVASPTDRLQWTMLCVATAITGSGWSVAQSVARESSRFRLESQRVQ
jgi:uncharacterized membrane protein